MAEITCAGCGLRKPHRAKQLCIKCYDKLPRRIITCLGCGERKEHRARHLCDVCYGQHANKFPKMPHSLGSLQLEGEDRRDSMRVMPISPTMARPGTEEKIRVMIARHARMELLYHPYDCVLPKLIESDPIKRRDGGWHNNPSLIFSTPDLCDDD